MTSKQWDDAHIILGRIGDDDREKTVRHLENMTRAGYISFDEKLVREQLVVEAQVRETLAAITEDLPAVKGKGYFADWDWGEKKYLVPVILTGMFLSVCSAIMPGVLLAVQHKFDTVTGQAVFIPLLILGILGFFASLVLLFDHT